MRIRRAGWSLAAAGVLSWTPLPAVACSVCVGSTPYEPGLYWSVIFLLPVPFLLAGALVWWIRRHLNSL